MFRYFAFLLSFTVLFSCKNQKKEPFCVTYRVTSNLMESESLLISYKDSNEYVTIQINDHQWSKDICLPPDGFASLLVYPQVSCNSNYERKLGKYAYLKEPRRIVCGEIIYEHKTVSKRSPELVSVSLFPLEL